MVDSKRPPLDEWLSLFESTVAAEGITTGAGAAAGNSIVDAGLIGVGANSFVSMLLILYPGQPRLVDSQDITAFNNVTGEVTFSGAYKGVAAAIPAGVPYKIVTFRFVPAEVAAIDAKIGTNVDAAGTATLFAWLARLGEAGIAITGAVNDGAPAITDFDTDLTEATDNHYNGMLLMFTEGPNIGQGHVIDDYGGAAKNVSFLAGDQWTDVPVNGNGFIIVPDPGALIRALHLIPGADSAVNVFMRDVIGGKTDTALQAATAADSMMRYVKGLLLGQSRQLFPVDFWSEPVEEVQLAAVAGDDNLPDVVVTNLPAGATVVRTFAMFKFRMVDNVNAGNVNGLQGATVANTSQVIRVRRATGPGAWADAINFVNTQFTLALSTRESGDVCIGSIDISGTVTVDDTYNVIWLQNRALFDFLNFNDVQVGLRLWYSV